MIFWRFFFSFLYLRNWHTGQWEISRPRLFLFLAISRPRLFLFLASVFLVVLALILIGFLQAPLIYEAI